MTAEIVAAIEAGADTCIMPWHAGVVPMAMPRNAATEMPYHGVNVVSLWATATTRLYHSGYWASYEQWRRIGAQVRKGERGTLIIFYKKLDGGSDEDARDAADAPRFVIRYSHVFNFAQVDGWEHPATRRPTEVETIEQVEAFVRATGAEVRHGFSGASYGRADDRIRMPAPSQFTGTPTSSPTEAYYATLLHELMHWTGAPHRLGRAQGASVGDLDYAFEELIAELGAAFLCSVFGIANSPRDDHAAYIAHWLEILGRDTKAVFRAASKAQEAVQYLQTIVAERMRA